MAKLKDIYPEWTFTKIRKPVCLIPAEGLEAVFKSSMAPALEGACARPPLWDPSQEPITGAESCL